MSQNDPLRPLIAQATLDALKARAPRQPIPANCTCDRGADGQLAYRRDDCPVHSHREPPRDE